MNKLFLRILLCVTLVSCNNATIDQKCSIRIYEVLSQEEAINLVGSQQVSQADIEYGLGSLYGKLRRNQTFSINDTIAVNNIIRKTNMPKDVLATWVELNDAHNSCDLVLYNQRPIIDTDVVLKDISKDQYSNNIFVAFTFSDTEKWENVTTSHINKRLAVSVNGKIVSAPMVNSSISNGNCSIIISKSVFEQLFPNIKLSDFINRDN